MGSACCKGKGAKKGKNAKQNENKGKLNKIQSHEIENPDEADTERVGASNDERKRPVDPNDKTKIHGIVVEAIANTKGLVTLPQVEAYISDKYRNFPMNSYRRRAVFTKVIADEFYKGQLAVKTNKYCT